MRYRISANLLAQTFSHFRSCGGGRRECQVLWTSPWASPATIGDVVHSEHRAHGGGFDVDSSWINRFWIELAERADGVRVQVHTHPHDAFHSETDDSFPIIHTPGFLSLVIPRFGIGVVGFESAYLTEIQPDGTWREVAIREHLEVTP